MSRTLLVVALLAAGCGSEADRSPASLEPAAVEDHECAACGMIVRDQPAPRGQLIHRDGTRVFLCSIADLVTYERAPSPHGAPAATYVEVMAADADPADTSTAARPWRSVDRAEFVVGGLHRPVMGEPVLVFDDLATARAAAERLGSRAVDWEELKEALDEDGRVPGNE